MGAHQGHLPWAGAEGLSTYLLGSVFAHATVFTPPMDRKLATRAMQAHLALCLFAHAVSATVTSGDHSLGMMNLSTAAARKRAVDDPTVVQTWAPTTPCKPSFMVIGGPKCGSTSLFEYLEAHPQVHRPAQKELCFFPAIFV